ncbi:MAG: OB-fold domain-containing protein [Proteobacteria bacterium]|nr:OB-fold domain-containing protein [Pseudomonadota bacterium]MCZ6783860.1 OB-fold domain-containing protein [Pseudomonadota bacterium]
MAVQPSTYKLEFPYKRSLGPVVGTFLTGLRDRKILGICTSAGRVLVPPLEYDPETGDANPDDWREVGPSGAVEGWTWVEKPGPKQPLGHAFAWALVKLDGADTAMLHALDAGSIDRVQTGMRVRARWAAETRGHITDIECFEPFDPAES